MQQTAIAGAGLGRGGSPRTRRALGAALCVLAVAGVVAVVLGARDPAAFRDRALLPSCGSATVAAGAFPPAAGAACFDGALGGPRGAELRVVRYTPEGDQIVEYYRALPGGGAEVLIDSSEDQYGSRGWARRSCPRPTSLRVLGDCSTVRL